MKAHTTVNWIDSRISGTAGCRSRISKLDFQAGDPGISSIKLSGLLFMIRFKALPSLVTLHGEALHL